MGRSGRNAVLDLIKEVPSNLRRLFIRKIRRFNLMNSVDKVIDRTLESKGERAPFPEQIQKKVDQALKENPELLKSIVSDRNETLLERLKSVFVTSVGHNKDLFGRNRLKPLDYNLFRPDDLFENPEKIPEGKFTLAQAKEFLKDFQKNPDPEYIDALAYKYKIDSQYIMQMLTHTKIFKIVQPLHKKEQSSLSQNLESLAPALVITEPDEEKVYRILDTRQEKFQRFYKEKLGIANQNFTYAIRNPALRTIFASDDSKMRKLEPGPQSEIKYLTPKGKTVTVRDTDKTKTLEVCDLKPGEDPEAWEVLPDWKGLEGWGRSRQTPSAIHHESTLIMAPEDDNYDVFREMKKEDRKVKRKSLEEEKKNAEMERKLNSNEEEKIVRPQDEDFDVFKIIENKEAKNEEKKKLPEKEHSSDELESRPETNTKLQPVKVRGKISSENS